MISCREVARLVLSDEIHELSGGRRLQVRVHLLMCRHCRRLLRQLETIREHASAWWSRLQHQVGPGEPPDLEAKILTRLEGPPHS